MCKLYCICTYVADSKVGVTLYYCSFLHRVKEVVGYDPVDFVGTTMSDYFHPGDCKKLIRCERTRERPFIVTAICV